MDLSGYCDDSLVLTNTVYKKFNPYHHHSLNISTVPALGLTWSHCVTTRIILFKAAYHSIFDKTTATRTSGELDGDVQEDVVSTSSAALKRVMYLQFSPTRPTAYCYYKIATEGIVDAIENASL